ncbi:MAG TPA: 2OG-Fe(II) oxygenase [Burkholderiales bacterium]|jgi:SM-20-related protein
MEPTRLIIQFLPDLAPADLHREVWNACLEKRWYFGNQSTEDGAVPFWKMDLDDSTPVRRLWEHARPRCEQLAGSALRMVRQYANGHTYGQGGRAHRDDGRAGTYTLLYYPMPEWRPEWEGETMFVDERGEIVAALKPEPNRAVFFDSRVPHYGRAPARLYSGLRVTIAYKLEAT